MTHPLPNYTERLDVPLRRDALLDESTSLEPSGSTLPNGGLHDAESEASSRSGTSFPAFDHDFFAIVAFCFGSILWVYTVTLEPT